MMDVDESKIGEWPNVALIPGTNIHAATGEHVEQPENTRIGRSRGACRPISASSDSEPADVENGAQNGLECDTRETSVIGQPVDNAQADSREKLLEDANSLCLELWDSDVISGWTTANVLKKDIIKLLDRQDAITRAEWCNEQGWWDSAEECNRATAKVHDLQDQVDSLTAERDELRSRLKTQADSFAKLERDNAQLRDKLERVRELLGGDAR